MLINTTALNFINFIINQLKICGDRIDNDNDGFIDETCSDIIRVEICGNNRDYDGDHLIDKACPDLPIDQIDPNHEEVCGNET
jgi:hypothetical protein